MRVAPDDDLYRVNAVWLGPRGLTFPWTARYLAYATWLVTFLAIVLAEVAIPALHPGVPPVWEITITTLFTYGVMSFVDHERPVRAVWQTFASELAAPRVSGKERPIRIPAKVRVRARPRHDRRLTRAYFAGTEHTVPTHAERYAGGRSATGSASQQRRRGIRTGRGNRPATPPQAAVGVATRGATSGATATRQVRAEGAAGAETKPRPAPARLRGRPRGEPRPTQLSPDRAGRR